MKLTKIALCFATVVLGVASAASSYTVTLSSDSSAGTTQLKAGAYKLQVEGSQAVFKQGKATIQIPVTVETAPSTFRYTEVETVGSKLMAIDLAGTKTRLVFAPEQATPSVTTGQ